MHLVKSLNNHNYGQSQIKTVFHILKKVDKEFGFGTGDCMDPNKNSNWRQAIQGNLTE